MKPGALRELIVESFGEAFAYSYFDRSLYNHPILNPWSLVAQDVFRKRADGFLKKHGIKLGPPLLVHINGPQKRAA